jgi:hypothetical protein
MKIAGTFKKAAAGAGVIAAFMLTSCGGGSDSPTLASGTFIDSPVAGLAYLSGSTSGTTDAAGNFQYEVGSTVTFRVGGVTLGTVTPKAVITPVDLVTGATDETNATVTNIAKFLQTIDDDNNTANGITISSAAATAAQNLTLNFAQSTVAFEGDASVTTAINTITTATASGLRPLISTADAQNHLKANLIDRLTGTYTGTYTGASSGTFAVTVNAAGSVTGSGVEGGLTFPITGTVASNGTGALGSAGLATFSANINPDSGTITGTWQWIDGSGGGTLSGAK